MTTELCRPPFLPQFHTDDTLFAIADGVVMFDVVHGRKRVNIVPVEAE